MNKLILSAILLLLTGAACQTQTNNTKARASKDAVKEQNIPYKIAQNYFVNNSFTGLDNPKIESEKEFNEVFGMATTMGKDGKPTAIDFSKQNIIALILAETDIQTSIELLNLIKNEKNEIVLSYRLIQGAQQSYTTLPSVALIIDKSWDGAVILQEVK